MQKTLATMLLAAVGGAAFVAGADDRRPDPGGVYVGAAEIEATIAAMGPEPVADRALRIIPVAGRYNVGVSAVRRLTVDGRTPRDAIEHDHVTEVYHVVEGHGVLVTGGTLEDPKPLPPESPVVREIVGPSSVGTGIRGGTRQRVGPGDVVVIPQGTPHGFVEIEGARIVYTVVRVDPDRVLVVPAKPLP